MASLHTNNINNIPFPEFSNVEYEKIVLKDANIIKIDNDLVKKLSTVKSLFLIQNNNLIDVKLLKKLQFLEILFFIDCKKINKILINFPTINNLKSLTIINDLYDYLPLRINFANKLPNLTNLFIYKNFIHIDLHNLYNLEQISTKVYNSYYINSYYNSYYNPTPINYIPDNPNIYGIKYLKNLQNVDKFTDYNKRMVDYNIKQCELLLDMFIMNAIYRDDFIEFYSLFL